MRLFWSTSQQALPIGVYTCNHQKEWDFERDTLSPIIMEVENHPKSGQIIIFHQPRFPWNKGNSLTKPPFGVRSREVAIIWPAKWKVGPFSTDPWEEGCHVVCPRQCPLRNTRPMNPMAASKKSPTERRNICRIEFFRTINHSLN